MLNKTALLLEEKASKLSRRDPRWAELLQLAKAFRLLHLERAKPEYRIKRFSGSFAKRALHVTQKATSLPADHPDRERLLAKAQEASVYNALEKLNPSTLTAMTGA